MESPVTIYSFTIKNNTNHEVLIKVKPKDDKYFNIYTLENNNVYYVRFYKLQCYTDYKDSLITHFFSELNIDVNNQLIKKNPYDYSNWKVNLDTLSGFRCKSGICNYFLEIESKD
jgi:hypothetical protein